MYGEPILLASESSRRGSILESIRIPFIRVMPSIDETAFDDLDPGERVIALATTKAKRGNSIWFEKTQRERVVKSSIEKYLEKGSFLIENVLENLDSYSELIRWWLLRCLSVG